MSNNLATYTAELVAIIVALQWTEDVRPDGVIICSDSMSALNSLVSINSKRIDVKFWWIPHRNQRNCRSVSKKGNQSPTRKKEKLY